MARPLYTEITPEIRNSKTYQTLYKKKYGSDSRVIFSKIKNSLDEAGYDKKGIYHRTEGLVINFKKGISSEERNSIYQEIIELGKKYENIIQISHSPNLQILTPENIREKNMVMAMNQSYSTQYRRDREKRARIRKTELKNKDVYKGEITALVRKYFKNLTGFCYGEYFKNVEGEELIILMDGAKLSIANQKKTISKELYNHLVEKDLILFVDYRENYKKFYFSDELFNNVRKYFRIHEKRKLE